MSSHYVFHYKYNGKFIANNRKYIYLYTPYIFLLLIQYTRLYLGAFATLLWSSASPATKKNVTRIGFWSLTICLCLSLTVCLLVALFCCQFPFVPCSGSPLRNSFAWPRACCMSAKQKLELRHLGNVSFISAIVSTWNTKQGGKGG